MLCKYRDVFGKPHEGVHRWRFLGFASIDLLGTALIAFLISCYFRGRFIVIFLSLMAIAIVAHRLFCVNTTLNKMIFGEIVA